MNVVSLPKPKTPDVIINSIEEALSLATEERATFVGIAVLVDGPDGSILHRYTAQAKGVGWSNMVGAVELLKKSVFEQLDEEREG